MTKQSDRRDQPTGCPVAANFHPFRWEDAEDPFESLRALRRECPVTQPEFEPLPPIKFFTRFEDVLAIYTDWKTFANMGVIIDKKAHLATPVEERSIISSDPPHHGPMRRLILTAMAPKNVDLVVPSIAEYAKSVVDKIARQGRADMVDEWAAPIPSVGIARVIGLPDADALKFRKWVKFGIDQLAISLSPSSNRAGGPSTDLYGDPNMFGDSGAYIHRWIAERRANPNPPDDTLNRMLNFVDRETGKRFTDDEVADQIVTMIAAGNDTTANLMGNLLYRMLSIPGLYDRMREDRSLVPLAIEESLRYDPPQQMFPRLCTRDTTVNGTEVKEGEVVVISMASANRDEVQYGDDAEEFKIGRKYPAPKHFGMGYGIHTCVGGYLARETAKVSFNALLDRIPRMSLEPGFKYRKVIFHHFRGPQHLPVLFDPA